SERVAVPGPRPRDQVGWHTFTVASPSSCALLSHFQPVLTPGGSRSGRRSAPTFSLRWCQHHRRHVHPIIEGDQDDAEREGRGDLWGWGRDRRRGRTHLFVRG